MKQPNVYYHDRMLAYKFSETHPMNMERLRRTTQLLEAYGVASVDPGPGDEADLLRVHDPEYVNAVRRMSETGFATDMDASFGFGAGDNPAFPGMYEAALATTAGSVAGAWDLVKGAKRAFSFGGGLHHARPEFASGFCIFNDPAIAIDVMRCRFDRIAYVDIDVHHGDGVQAIYLNDSGVLTCSIHQDGRTLYPGTGFPDEVGAHFTSINVNVPPGTTGEAWLYGLREGILPAIERFQPDAMVLELGVDSHWTDPLANVQNTVQEWLEGVRMLGQFDVPILALGGGGYDLHNPHRMWVGAYFVLTGQSIPVDIPEPYATRWGTPTIPDAEVRQPTRGMVQVQEAVEYLQAEVFPKIPGASSS